MHNVLDFSSWQALLSTLLGLAVFSLVVAGIRLLVVQAVQKRRDLREAASITEPSPATSRRYRLVRLLLGSCNPINFPFIAATARRAPMNHPLHARMAPQSTPRAPILLASSRPDVLARWQSSLEGFAPLGVVDRLGALRDALAEQTAQLLLLDLDMHGVESPVAVAVLANLSPRTRIVVLGGAIDDARELALFRAGAWGCCSRDIEAQLLKRVVHAVGLGEIWIRRSLTKRLVDELVRDDTPGMARLRARLASLTHREQQIAALVGSGGSNKQIARTLAISERTVKAHLTEIFRKLGTADRLKLALLLSRSA